MQFLLKRISTPLSFSVSRNYILQIKIRKGNVQPDKMKCLYLMECALKYFISSLVTFLFGISRDFYFCHLVRRKLQYPKSLLLAHYFLGIDSL